MQYLSYYASCANSLVGSDERGVYPLIVGFPMTGRNIVKNCDGVEETLCIRGKGTTRWKTLCMMHTSVTSGETGGQKIPSKISTSRSNIFSSWAECRYLLDTGCQIVMRHYKIEYNSLWSGGTADLQLCKDKVVMQVCILTTSHNMIEGLITSFKLLTLTISRWSMAYCRPSRCLICKNSSFQEQIYKNKIRISPRNISMPRFFFPTLTGNLMEAGGTCFSFRNLIPASGSK